MRSRSEWDVYINRIAARNRAEAAAVGFEPRLFYDTFVFDGTTQRVFGNPDIFRNGERFPIRITHLIAAMQFEAPDVQLPVAGDERMVQRYGLRIRAHGTYYQNAIFSALPLYANRAVAAADPISQSQASWRFNRPIVLGNRDTFQVEVQLLVAPAQGQTERVDVSFHGIGLYSEQPKMLTGFVELGDTVKDTISVDSYRNDGTEPMAIDRIAIHQSPPVQTQDPVGNIRNVALRVRLNGNGTNQWWNVGPSTVGGSDLVPAHLWGFDEGRAIVHQLPGDGWLWYPNEQISPELESFDAARQETVLLGVAGTLLKM